MTNSNKVEHESVPPASASGFSQYCPKIAVASTAQRDQTQSGRRACPHSFEQIEHREHRGTTGTNRTAGTSGTNNLFSTYGGTAGQRGSNILFTTIKCPTELSHFWDRWDKIGKSYAFRRDPTWRILDLRPHGSADFTPKGVTLTFSGTMGHGTKLRRIATDSNSPKLPATLTTLPLAFPHSTCDNLCSK
jgi:hypothetical protein